MQNAQLLVFGIDVFFCINSGSFLLFKSYNKTIEVRNLLTANMEIL